jgi:uroporphyrinogen-III synthase
MTNGKPGDHPLTDILCYGIQVYGPDVDDLVRQVAALSDDRGMRELGDLLLAHPRSGNAGLLRPRLERRRDELRADALKRGWEVDT